LSTRRRVVSIVGTRPNFVKMAPIQAALARRPAHFEHVLVHTGQHYDDEMSDIFLRQLGVGRPDYQLDVGSAARTAQIGSVVERLRPVLELEQPDVVLVPGDVNSTLAAAIAAAELSIPVAHVEAGLRSFDPTMPEEANRIGADALSAVLFTHSPEAIDNLRREGIDTTRVHEVGNTMIDTLHAMLPTVLQARHPERLGLERGRYIVVTLHRPALVDRPDLLAETLDHLEAVTDAYDVVFPVHPRTQAAIERLGRVPRAIRLVAPLGYVQFLGLLTESAAAITDSGGIQEETTALGVPCFTLRDNTERPITVEQGTNVLLGLEPSRIRDVPGLLAGVRRAPAAPRGWDGHAAERIADVLAEVPLTPSTEVPRAVRELAEMSFPPTPVSVR
jgi:UDP-N-acetylglucosamine 2-epimerase (non-hydrolysing)